MSAVFGLLMMILGVFHGVEISCDGRQDGAQCYGALGGTVLLQLMDDASKIFRYQCRKESTMILSGREDRALDILSENRFSFARKNGIFRIDHLSRSDGGEYTLEIFDSNGKTSTNRTLQLIIQAPVSSVQLVSECLSQGQMKVTCSSGQGDSPQYSWTLNGRKLEKYQLYSGNHDTKTITLKQDVSGRLVCTVKNHVSSDKEEKKISTCGFEWFDCTLTNGTYIKQWLQPTNETLCEGTTPEGKETDVTVTNKPSYNNSTSNHTVITQSGSDTWYIYPSLVVCGLKAAAILIIIGIFLDFAWKKNKLMKAEGSAVTGEVEYENTVVMVEMRSSAAEP